MFDKLKYWKNREEGKRGQGEVKKSPVLPDSNNPAEIGFDEKGQMLVKNRLYRRKKSKLPNQRSYTTKVLNKEERKKERKKGRR